MSDEFTTNNGVSLDKNPKREDYAAPEQNAPENPQSYDAQQTSNGQPEGGQQSYTYGQTGEFQQNSNYGSTQDQSAYQQAYNGQPYYGQAQTKGTGTGFGIASLVLGIISIFTFACCINYILAILAIIFGIVQIVKNEKKGLAIAGIVLGVISIILAILVTIGVAGLAINSGDTDSLLQNYLKEYENLQEDSF